MPVCEGCGGSYDDQFKFCPYCGRARPEPQVIKVQLNVSDKDKLETCKIYYREWYVHGGGLIGELWAEAIGPNGMYLVGESPDFWTLKDGKNIAHSFLVNKLIKEGWEALALPATDKWWENDFRRIVKETNPKPWRTWTVHEDYRGLTFIPKRYTLVHSPYKLIQPAEKKEQNYEYYGESSVFKRTNKFNEERKKVLDEFLLKMIGEGFEPVEPSINDAFRKVQTNSLANWCYRILLKRE